MEEKYKKTYEGMSIFCALPKKLAYRVLNCVHCYMIGFAAAQARLVGVLWV